jgi:hypothetical protein
VTQTFEILGGLPPYGEPAVSFPTDWGRFGREGIVIAFRAPDTTAWVGNFEPGLEGITRVLAHPDHARVLVFSRGDLWVVDPAKRSANLIAIAISDLWPVTEPEGLILNREGLALVRLAADGVVWHTRRLSWDGFDRIEIQSHCIRGKAWNAVDDCWNDFEVDLVTGRSTGGSFPFDGQDDWERLASSS